jgi:flavin reductase (DIM6/NTAB) family NADH-FMN oxidoreductase RutF
MTVLTPEVLRTAFAAFPTGVAALAAFIDGAPIGMAVSSFTSVSLEPPLVSVCVARHSTTWPVLRRAPVLGVCVLAEEHGATARALAAKVADRFAELDWTSDDEGAVLLRNAALWLRCTLESELPAGDHDIALLRVRELELFPGVAPLVFHGSAFRQLASGRAACGQSQHTRAGADHDC